MDVFPLQRDPILAKQLFSALFDGILQEMETHKARGESGRIKEELRRCMNTFLSKSTVCFPPFIACIQVSPSEAFPLDFFCWQSLECENRQDSLKVSK